jgi:hypothetical protein
MHIGPWAFTGLISAVWDAADADAGSHCIHSFQFSGTTPSADGATRFMSSAELAGHGARSPLLNAKSFVVIGISIFFSALLPGDALGVQWRALGLNGAL